MQQQKPADCLSWSWHWCWCAALGKASYQHVLSLCSTECLSFSLCLYQQDPPEKTEKERKNKNQICKHYKQYFKRGRRMGEEDKSYTKSLPMTYLLSTSSKATTSLLVKSMASLLLMLSSDRIWAALALPIPCMYWSANLRGLLSGISIPALILRHRAPTPWNCTQHRRPKDDHDKYQHIKSVTFQISKLRIWGMINFSYFFFSAQIFRS